MMNSINEYEKTEQFVNDKLRDAQLDFFQVYSAVLQLNFIANNTSKNALEDIWVCITGNISVSNATRSDNPAKQSRPEVISQLYELIGKSVSSIYIQDNGVLVLCVEDKVLTICADDEPLEIIWSVTPGYPDYYAEHDWSICLTDADELVLKR